MQHSTFARISISFFVLLLVLIASFIHSLKISKTAKLVSDLNGASCAKYQNIQAIDVDKPLNVAVWNIYKLQNNQWISEIANLKEQNQIILLQESIKNEALLEPFYQSQWHVNQAYGFTLFNDIAGVMTLSESSPSNVCAFNQQEPMIRLPKTALVSIFPLSNGKQLAVINIHSVNFTFDMDIYKNQITAILNKIDNFDGPIIFAGDFNTWTEERRLLLAKALANIGLMPVSFMPDERLTVFGEPLDHIFYRGLTLENARSQSTEASDHAWLQAKFAF